ncbi:glutamate--tRNA ligase [Sphingobium sp. LSP13-1-1.1]|uniref:glutamate--tRNA ligase n=1 Tax=Sphingobium sp. LSP13-1-1.1 TaxID=3135234 RepID=UPI00344215E7
MTVITRFAPSPTGNLHVGNIRAALHNWLFARKNGGRFLLRLDDTDVERSRPEYADGIKADLSWLGLHWDGEERQSDRFALYEEKFEALKASGHVYPAYESAQELDLRRKVLLGRGLPPVYDRAALSLDAGQIAAYEAEGRRPHWRFRLDHDPPIAWTDLIRGDQRFDPKLLSDPVIRRADGSWLYMLPSVIDDIAMGVTHVLRGEDHVSNTATQIQMFAALGAPLPAFAHEALLTGSEGKLSKRLGSLGVAHFREVGLEPMAVASLLARLGSSMPVEPFTDLQPLIDSFDFAHFGRAPARFDEGELASLNQKIVHLLPYAAVADRLPQGMDEAAWDAIRPNLETLAGAADWWRIVTGPIDAPAPMDEDRDFLVLAHARLAEASFDAAVWRTLTEALKAETGRKGKALFLPLRRALTGLDHGPDMGQLLPLIGREEALARLAA